MVICVEHDEDILDEADERECPEDEAEDAEDVGGAGVRKREGREGIERGRPDVAVHHAQRLVRQQRQLPPGELLWRRGGAITHKLSMKEEEIVVVFFCWIGWMHVVRTYQRVAGPRSVRLAEGPAGEAADGDLLVADDAAFLLGDLTRRDSLVHGRHGCGVHLDDHIRRRRAVLHRRWNTLGGTPGKGGGGVREDRDAQRPKMDYIITRSVLGIKKISIKYRY
jgi:hypothetical protein